MTSEEDQGEFVFEGKLEANTIYEWVKDYHSANPTPDENVQHPKLKPKLRSYQERAVRWMLSMERADNRTVRIANDGGKLVRFDKGGILADEMGLGKTVEVLACLLANPNTEYVKQLEEYIDKMKEDLLKYEADDIKNADESTEMETENREEETSRPQRRRKIKENVVNVEVISGNVATQNECSNKTKRRRGKSVYSEILDCTLFENNLSQNENNQSQNENNVCQNETNLSQNENNLSQNENNRCENENNLSQNENNLSQNENNWCENENNLLQNENNLCENENNLSQNENNLSQNENNRCENENNLSQNENNLSQNENNRCENENNLSQNENNLSQNENNRCENENNLSQNENNLCENENNVCQNENNVRQNENNVCENDVPQNVDALGKETDVDLRKFESLCTEFNLRNRLEDKDVTEKPEQGDNNCEDEANDVAGDDSDRRGSMEVESKKPIEENGGDGLKASDKQVIDEVESKTCGRKRSRKAVAPKRNNKLLKQSSDHEDEDDEDFVFKTPASLSPSKPPSRRSTAGTTPRQKQKNDEISEDSDSDFVCKSTDSASSSRRSTRRKQSMVVCDDMLFDGDVDDPGVVDDPVKVTSAPRRRPRTKSKSDDPDFAPAPKKRAKSAKSGLLRAEMQKMYEAMLAETSPALKRAKIALLKMESDYRCCCLDPSLLSDAITVQCPICRKLQHPDCVGFESAVPYVCFTCWPQRALVPSSATLIVTPNSISSQWSDEIKKHLADSDLKVLVYEGVRGGEGYKQPLQLAQYDIVVTTYQVLLKEIDYVNEDPGNRPRAMRYARKFFPPTSPLTCVKWWRICLDEAQMVECITSKLYTMVSALHTVNRWAVCGTPIQRQAADLFGLVAFLRVDPYGSSKTSWHSLESNRQALAEFLPHVMWRTSKCHVLHELNVPPQTTCVHWLAFAPVETFFYRKQHALCSHQFQHKAQQLLGRQPLSKPLCQVASKHLSALLAPLLRLRQACVHPQLVKSQFVTIRHTLTMGELLDQMVAKATLDAEEALRQLVASLNGVAGARLLTGEAIEAVNMYRRVLHLAQEYEGRLKMDTLQKIHTMYNLATVLQSNTVSVAPTLRDATLLDDVKSLETDYLIKRLGDVEGTKAALKELAEKFTDKIPSKKLRGCDWWSDMLHDMDTKQLLHKIQVEFEHAKGPLMAMLTKMSGLLGLMEELYQWQIRIDKTRQSVIEQIKQMEEVPTAVMAGHAVNCHLRNQKPSTVNNRCLICRTENELKHYESLLFWIMNKDDTKSKSPSKKRDEKDDYEWQQLQKQQSARSSGADTNQKTTVANLENNTIFEVYNVGTWKPSQHEQIIRLIYSSHSKRLLNREWTEESQKQFSALDILRKEFRRLRLLWSQIADQVAASDELVMAKLRLRLATTEEYLADEQLAGSSRRITALRKNDNEKRNVICPLQVDAVIGQLQAEAAVNESALKKTAGTLYYLQNLQKNGDKQTEPCPVCKNQLTDTWSVLKCGHCYCYDCIHTLTHSFKRESITCPVCRECTPSADVSHIEARHTSAHSQIKAQVNGSFTTKIEAMVAELLALRAEQPDVKVLMFSVWDGVLDVLGEALALNEVVYCRLSSTNSRKRKWQTVLATFKSDPCACALLMPLRSGAKGLNLVEATHVFLAEPILNPADELQAVGRVHRIGQTRKTFVHKFAVKGTIEEKMLTAMEGSDSNWSKDKVTVQQLLDLFTPF